MGTSGKRKSVEPFRAASRRTCVAAPAPQPPCEPTGSAQGSAIVKRCARAVRHEDVVARALCDQVPTEPRRHRGKMPPFFLAAIRDTKTKKRFGGNTRIEKTRSGRFRGSTSAVKRRSMTPLDRRDAGHRSFTDRLGFHVASACLSMTAALAPRNTSRDGLKIPNENLPASRDANLAVRYATKINFGFFCKTRSVSLRALRPGDTTIPPRLARPCDYVRLRAGGRSRTPLTCWRP